MLRNASLTSISHILHYSQTLSAQPKRRASLYPNIQTLIHDSVSASVLRELLFFFTRYKIAVVFWNALASIYSTDEMTTSFDRCSHQPSGKGVGMFGLCQFVNEALSPSPCGSTSIQRKERTLNHFDPFCPSRATIPVHYEVILFQQRLFIRFNWPTRKKVKDASPFNFWSFLVFSASVFFLFGGSGGNDWLGRSKQRRSDGNPSYVSLRA